MEPERKSDLARQAIPWPQMLLDKEFSPDQGLVMNNDRLQNAPAIVS
jgi:hypothetical protein